MSGVPPGLLTCLMITAQCFVGLWLLTFLFGGSSQPAAETSKVGQSQHSLQQSFSNTTIGGKKMAAKDEESNLHFLVGAAVFVCAACIAKVAGNMSLPRAHALHILFENEADCIRVKEQLAQEPAKNVYTKFQELAKQHSKCPSGKDGGSLGVFRRGAMAKEFDDAVFLTADVATVHGPVRTSFGFHLIYVTGREERKVERAE
mmetsp:Transcript_24518/g.49811  ORF Transcript_24518/g.49811 Transcript_24518/m.49811 type:complete len:203 (+) Transcript_24518:62-670(+)